jgi:N-methylhydantoinase A/oxoprolinase/acetone carboxylase beta subunit
MGSKDKYRSKIEERVKEDFPDMTSEEVKAHADVLNEANESVKRLIDNGMPKALAVKLISMIVEGNKEFSSPEELAEFMKEITNPVEVASEPDEDNSVVEAVKNIIVSSETIPNASGIEYWRRIGGE